VTRCGIQSVTSVPSNDTLPSSGVTMPLMMSKAVVFPAPLGPISPVIDPSVTENEQPLTAWMPP
jgi:hypothetical protein